MQELKEDPGSFQLDTLLAEIVKLERVKAIGLPAALLEAISEKVVAGARAMKMYPSDFEVAAAPVRITLLAALCQVRQAELVDGLVELLIQLVHKISVRADPGRHGQGTSASRSSLPVRGSLNRKPLLSATGSAPCSAVSNVRSRGYGETSIFSRRPGRAGMANTLAARFPAAWRYSAARRV
ncbi:hypothetical protein [Microbispora bryophytorum]|uniref:hypothetical protein n=1 Tax=Microbispora bryophytorum TaxID=1460882 RepID=UPI0033E9E32D